MLSLNGKALIRFFFRGLLSVIVVFSWAFRLRRRALRYIFARSAIASLAKDAASIPNA